MKKILIITAGMILCIAAAHAQLIIDAAQSGNIWDNSNWGDEFTTAPVAGDTNTWNTAGFVMTVGTADPFHGGLLEVTEGSRLASVAGSAGNNPQFQATTFDGGGITNFNNAASTYDFNGKAVTFAAGGATFDSNAQNRNIVINNSVWAGSGAIASMRTGTLDAENLYSTFQISAGSTVTGYTGTISLTNTSSAVDSLHRLIIQAATNGSFAVNIGTRSLLHLSVTPETLTFASLVLGEDTIAPGTYAFGDFTATQQGFLFAGANPASITVIPEPAAIGLIFVCGLAAIVIRRRLKA